MKILVAGVGNIFLGDDGFGVEVAQRLGRETWPDGVHIADYGIRGVHLAHELLRDYDLFVLVDAAPRGESPGTLFAIEPDFSRDDALDRGASGFLLDAHGMDPELVVAMVRDLGGEMPRTVIVGCEPADVDERIGLSPAVAASVDGAVAMVRDLVARELAHERGSRKEVYA